MGVWVTAFCVNLKIKQVYTFFSLPKSALGSGSSGISPKYDRLMY
jgi:hypothetical protein